MPPPRVRIFCFTWNTESVRIAEAVQHSGQEPLSLVSEQFYRCEQPDFLPALMRRALPHESLGGAQPATHDCGDARADADTLAASSGTAGGDGGGAAASASVQLPYDILVFALQESAKPGDYLLSHALPRELGSRYTLLRRQRLIGAGKTTWTSLRRDWAFKLRGVRIAVFVRPAFEPRVTLLGDAFIPCAGRERVTHGKGGVAVVLHVRGIGVLAFLNVHLPFESATVRGTNRMRIQTGVAQQNQALNALVDDVQERYHGIHYLFVLGDLNYRVLHRESAIDARAMYDLVAESAEQRRRVYETRDELRQSIDYGALPPFREGVANAGPSTFMPTAKMARGRTPAGTTARDAYRFGDANHRTPSWCDRILYATHRELLLTERSTRPPLPPPPPPPPLAPDASSSSCRARAAVNSTTTSARRRRVIEGDADVRCTMYERFEEGRTMTMSDHAGVIGGFEIYCTDYAPRGDENSDADDDADDDEDDDGSEQDIFDESHHYVSAACFQQQPSAVAATPLPRSCAARDDDGDDDNC